MVLLSFSNDIDVLRPLMPQVREALPAIEPGRLYRIRLAAQPAYMDSSRL
jgi:hypothetical protein